MGHVIMHLKEGPVLPCFAQWLIRSETAGYLSHNNIAEAKITSFSSVVVPHTSTNAAKQNSLNSRCFPRYSDGIFLLLKLHLSDSF